MSMEWTPGGVSNDVEDRRGGGGGFRMGGIGGPHIGIGGGLLLLVLSLVFHRNFLALFSGSGDDTAPSSAVTQQPVSGPPDRQVQFVSFVLDDVQKTWETLLPQQGRRQYRHAKLVLFQDFTDSGCGSAQSATGPFYCPTDEKVYIDLGFFNELSQRFGAPGEFAQAYVLAHEIGHHVQKLLGIESSVSRMQQSDPSSQNRLSVGLELQADCFAGIWGHSTEQRKIVDDADIQAGLRAAASVGDDRIQRMEGRRVSPETFTHGSAAQRSAAFQKGLDSGTLSVCMDVQ
jgi:predicted metalloprotease